MQIYTDDTTQRFQILDVDFLELVLITDALAEISQKTQVPVDDMIEICVRAVDLACQAERKRSEPC